MSVDVNINRLFARLRLEHFLVYLPGNGWRGAQEKHRDRVRFELPDDDSPYVLLLPRSADSRQCRKLLERAVYSLSGIENRQPIEILRDLLTETVGRPADTDATPIRLRLRNRQDREITVAVASRSGDNSLMPGEAIEILYHPSPDDAVEITLQGDRVQIRDDSTS